MKYFFDCETTGLLGVSASEIIEGYFLLVDDNDNVVDDYLFQASPEKWEVAAEEVHNISLDSTVSHPEKSKALFKLLKWINPALPIYIYVNPNTIYGYVYYDKSVIQLMFLDLHIKNLISYHDFYKYFRNFVNVYEIVKDAQKNGIIKLQRDNKTKRLKLSQSQVYKSLFNRDYIAHNAKQDVLALREIYEYLKQRINNKSATSNQTSFC